jgi:hypothetical protein
MGTLSRPFGTRLAGHPVPNAEALGYSRSSLRDNALPTLGGMVPTGLDACVKAVSVRHFHNDSVPYELCLVALSSEIASAPICGLT